MYIADTQRKTTTITTTKTLQSRPDLESQNPSLFLRVGAFKASKESSSRNLGLVSLKTGWMGGW